MPIELDDPALLVRLECAGVRSIYEPLLFFLANGAIDLDRTLAIAINAQRDGLRLVPSGKAALILAQILHASPPTCFEPYVDDGVLGGLIPFRQGVWGGCRYGHLAVRTYAQYPDTVRDALAGRPLSQLIDLPAFAGRSYLIDSCVVEDAVTVATCPVDTVPIGDAVRWALHARSAGTV